MAELWLIRHGQASFGAADYDRLSDLGHTQARALGRALAGQGLRPDRLVIGSMRRHRETLEGVCEGLGTVSDTAEIHAGLDEFDFTGLLNARFPGGGPDGMHSDRKTHFRTLRDTVAEWRADAIADPPETWGAFTARIEAARREMTNRDATVVAVSSGGPIGQMVAAALNAPPEAQIQLQLQTKNCSVTRFVFTPRAFYLHSFNECPHVSADTAHLLTYS
jgi:broad specificity phosphatase PhoE